MIVSESANPAAVASAKNTNLKGACSPHLPNSFVRHAQLQRLADHSSRLAISASLLGAFDTFLQKSFEAGLYL